jgi:hypothetical protein
MRARWLLGLAVVSVMGCGGRTFAPVSGKVTLNGKPLAGATVVFQPVAPEGSIEAAGPGSQAKTDDKGEFTLKCATGENGAVVGKHRVMISLLDTKVGESDERAPRGGWPLENQVPVRYNDQTELTRDVPPGGKRFEFALTSP